MPGLEKIEINTWDKVFSINLNSIVIVLQSILPQMKKNKFGSIVHISSIDALSGDNKPQDAYGSSKAALLRLSKSISIQFANKNIRSNSILPGPVETPMQERWKKNPESKKNISNDIRWSMVSRFFSFDSEIGKEKMFPGGLQESNKFEDIHPEKVI